MFNSITSIITIVLSMVAFIQMADLCAYRQSVIWPLLKKSGYGEPKKGPFMFWNLVGAYREYFHFADFGPDSEYNSEAERYGRKLKSATYLLVLFLLALFWSVIFQQLLR